MKKLITLAALLALTSGSLFAVQSGSRGVDETGDPIGGTVMAPPPMNFLSSDQNPVSVGEPVVLRSKNVDTDPVRDLIDPPSSTIAVTKPIPYQSPLRVGSRIATQLVEESLVDQQHADLSAKRAVRACEKKLKWSKLGKTVVNSAKLYYCAWAYVNGHLEKHKSNIHKRLFSNSCECADGCCPPAECECGVGRIGDPMPPQEPGSGDLSGRVRREHNTHKNERTVDAPASDPQCKGKGEMGTCDLTEYGFISSKNGQCVTSSGYRDDDDDIPGNTTRHRVRCKKTYKKGGVCFRGQCRSEVSLIAE